MKSETDRIAADVYFAQIPEWVLYSGISAQAIRLYCVLHRYANGVGTAFPSRRTLAERLGVGSTRTVDAALKELTALGAITSEQRRDGAGDLTSNLYTVRFASPVAQQSAGGSAENCSTCSAENCSRGSAADCSVIIARSNQSQIDPEIVTPASSLANLLADKIAENGNKRPTVTKDWIQEIDRLIRLDQRTPEQVEGAIRWATQDGFWSRNILSPTKLRKHYDRLRSDALAGRSSGQKAVAEYLQEVGS